MTNYDIVFEPSFEEQRIIGKRKAMLYLVALMVVISILMIVGKEVLL